jgi:hypothetical protein
MTSEDDQEDGFFSLASSSIGRIDSAVSHPLRSEEEEVEEEAMSAEERSRLLQSSHRHSRPHTFAGQKSAISEDDDDADRLPERLSVPAAPTASSSWGHSDPRGRLDYQGLGTGLNPSRPSTIRSASHTGMPSLGTGYEGHISSRLRIEDEAGVQTWRAGAVGATPLERTIDAIGMGRYQYAVLVLSGLGWAADNMWLQGIAIVLPRVQDEWKISDRWIGLVSSCTFAGMMVGALAWGSCESLLPN